MKPAAFAYFTPTQLDEAVGLLTRYGDEARLLAGGQSLVPLLNMRLARPGVLVDLNRIDSLRYIRSETDHIALGALTRHAEVEDSALVRERCPLLHAAVAQIGHRTIRNRGTVGGSLAHADPAAELPAVLACLDGEVTLTGPAGTRQVRAADFFLGYLTTARASDEILSGVRIPALAPTTGWACLEISRRPGDFALVGVAATVDLEPDTDRCAQARLALFGVGGTPINPTEATQLLVGEKLTPAVLDAVQSAVMQAVEPESDVQASAEYRRDVAGVIVQRALKEAWERAANSKGKQ